LKLKYDETLSNFALFFNLRRYTQGRAAAPDFGQDMAQRRFEDIKRFVPWQCADLRNFETDPWSMFRPGVRAFNANRRAHVTASNIKVADESMSAFQPRTTKTGQLPNLSFVQRKPKPLGTEFKTVADSTSGSFWSFFSLLFWFSFSVFFGRGSVELVY